MRAFTSIAAAGLLMALAHGAAAQTAGQGTGSMFQMTPPLQGGSPATSPSANPSAIPMTPPAASGAQGSTAPGSDAAGSFSPTTS
ncbi:MAG TPA: hypothetical protein VIQ29_16540, partial [Ancylobacter sp.]